MVRRKAKLMRVKLTHYRVEVRSGAENPLATLCPMPTADQIRERIEAAIPGARAEVDDWTGGGDHFKATVIAPAFAGLSRIEQHRLVYGVFGDEIGGPIHALSLQTKAE
jgi:stress-induced morphogen